MATVVLSPCNVVNFLNGGGGHFWVYMQYALGLRQLGCEVYWLEQVHSSGDADDDAARVKSFLSLMKGFGFGEQAIVYRQPNEQRPEVPFVNVTRAEAQSIFRRA